MGFDMNMRPCSAAHTCFNHLLLPEYSDAGTLRDRLVTAICTGRCRCGF